jgi:exosortase E/protease (VPEID-CTERM system)
VVHWTSLGGLLVVECAVLGTVFHAATLLGDAGWWFRLLGQLKLLSWLGTAMGTGLLIFGIAQLRQARPALKERLRCPQLAWPFLVGHLVGFLVFAQMTTLIVEQHLLASPQADAWVMLWAGTGVVTFLTLGAAVLPGWGFGVVLAVSTGGVGAWVVGGCTLHLWDLLIETTFSVVRALLSLLFRDVVCQPDLAVLGTSTFRVHIAPACSGCEGIGLIWVCLGLALWCYRKDLRWPRALLLIPLGTALVWGANTLRITALIAVGVWISPEVAVGGFHSQAGWLTFNGIALGLIAVAMRGGLFAQRPATNEETYSSAPYLMPLLALLAATMISTALSSGFDTLYPLRVVAVGLVLWLYRRDYTAWSGSWSWQGPAIGVAAFALWMVLEPLQGAPSDTALRTGLSGLPTAWAIGWIGFRVLGSVVTVPLAEELAFRGYLLRRLVGADFQKVSAGQISWFAVLVSSLLFGVLHGRWIAGMLVGVLYALALCRRGKLQDAVLAHATTNGLIAAHVLATGSWFLWC